MDRKKRILWTTESSFIHTGFAVYAKEVMSRLHATGKYELGEYGAFSAPDDPRIAAIPWWFFSAHPPFGDKEAVRQYESSIQNQNGALRFEEACLAFRPDIVASMRDPWQFAHESTSSLRPFFHHAIMPTVDSEPHDEHWLESFIQADAVLTYTEWGQEVLRREAGDLINLVGVASPGADMEIFKPVLDRNAHKQAFGLPGDAIVIGNCMRNQPRKNFPDLIKAFAQFLKEAPLELSARSFLYLHTAYPDRGWDIPRLIKMAGVAARTLFTYACKSCHAVFPSLYMDARGTCPNCGNLSASLPGSNEGVAREVLARIMNCFDVYVQYAANEGFGMPMAETGACGVPVFAVDFSAMGDVVRKLGGVPIKVKKVWCESESHAYKSYPDNDDLVAQLVKFFRLPQSVRAKRGFDARAGVARHFTYEKAAQAWGAHFDSIDVRDHSTTWASPARFHRLPDKIVVPDGLTDEEFVRWGMSAVAGRPELARSYVGLVMVRDLHWGASACHTGGPYRNESSFVGQPQFRQFNRDTALQDMMEICKTHNKWEERRVRT